MVALQAHQATVAGLTEGATQPEPPVGPAAPEEPPVVEQFQFPEVIKGFLYLRHVGITLQTRASLLRSSGGSLRYEKVAELLRKTELDAMVVGRATSQPEHSSFLADGQDDDYDEDYDDEEDWFGEDSGEDGFGGLARMRRPKEPKAMAVTGGGRRRLRFSNAGLLGGQAEVDGFAEGKGFQGTQRSGRRKEAGALVPQSAFLEP